MTGTREDQRVMWLRLLENPRQPYQPQHPGVGMCVLGVLADQALGTTTPPVKRRWRPVRAWRRWLHRNCGEW